MWALDKTSTRDRVIIDLEQMSFKCMKVVGMYNYLERKQELGTHAHENMIEICFMEKGAQHYQVEGKDYCMEGGDLLIIYPGEKHSTHGYHEEKGKMFWLILAIPQEGNNLLNLDRQESQFIIEQLLSFKGKRIFKGKYHLAGILNKLFKIYKESDSVFKRVRITNLLTGILILVVECGSEKDKPAVSQEFRQVTRYIEENPHEEILLETLADRVNLSLSHFK